MKITLADAHYAIFDCFKEITKIKDDCATRGRQDCTSVLQMILAQFKKRLQDFIEPQISEKFHERFMSMVSVYLRTFKIMREL